MMVMSQFIVGTFTVYSSYEIPHKSHLFVFTTLKTLQEVKNDGTINTLANNVLMNIFVQNNDT